MYVLRDRALVDRDRRRLEWDWPTTLVGVDIGPFLREVTKGHSPIARWMSWLLRGEIHVSPMSGTWLRAHEDDWNKHGVDV